MSTTEYQFSTAGPGYWTCPRCNTSVPQGCTHHCPTTAILPMPQPMPQATALDPVPAYHRIASALERIGAALEALAAKETS